MIETANAPALVDDAISSSAEEVLLSVTDSGCGMDEATLARIFEPFFTTKGPEKGTGLGLAMVQDVVAQNQGRIEVASQPGVGTKFTIRLPRDLSPAPVADVGVPAAQGRGHETVLLVEDDECVRALTHRVLVSQGYAVLQARDGNEALAICEQHLDFIHLVVTDVIMPNLSGRQMVERLLPLRPGMKVLYLSGYSDDAIEPHGVLGADAPLLEKPFNPDALAGAVRKVLDQH